MKNKLLKNRKSYRKKIDASFVTIIMLLSTMTAMVAFLAAPVVAEEAPADPIEARVWTTDEFGNPQDDFPPDSDVYIHGEGFDFTSAITITITRPDTIVETFYSNSNSEGNFIYIYDLNGIEGEYTVDATDGENSAETTFLDYTYTLGTFESDYSTSKTDFSQGETVYGKGTRSSSGTIRLRFRNPSNTVVKTCPSTYGKVTTCSYTLPGDAPTGEWDIEIQSRFGSSWGTRKTDHFTVSAPPVQNPELTESCGIDILRCKLLLLVL